MGRIYSKRLTERQWIAVFDFIMLVIATVGFAGIGYLGELPWWFAPVFTVGALRGWRPGSADSITALLIQREK